ncbi:MAG: hypothetical protein LBD72_02130 [Puniceicoccales bacterium]|jgi:hypothetical protein|nr:hypothetical protein [Puniceicoccales bacterium]
MCSVTLWTVDPNKDIVIKNTDVVSGKVVTALKLLRGVFSIIYLLTNVTKFGALICLLSMGGLAGLATISGLVGFAAVGTTGLMANIALLTPLLTIWMPIAGCVYAISVILAMLFNCLRHLCDQSILKKELPENPPIDIWQTFKSINNLRNVLKAILPSGYTAGGTKKLSVEIANDIALPLFRNMEYPRKINLIEILNNSGKIVGYVVRGRDNKTFCFIKYDTFSENFWRKDGWTQFASSSEFSSVISKLVL